MFTATEIGVIASQMGSEMVMRLSPYGNPIVKHNKTKGNDLIFSFYKHTDGYRIRRRHGYAGPFGNSFVLNGGKAFPSIVSAMAYFNAYKAKYPNSIIA